MKTVADSRRRITLPPGVKQGDVFDVEQPENGRFVLVRLEKPKQIKARLVRDDDGLLVARTSEPITNEMVRKALADFP